LLRAQLLGEGTHQRCFADARFAEHDGARAVAACGTLVQRSELPELIVAFQQLQASLRGTGEVLPLSAARPPCAAAICPSREREKYRIRKTPDTVQAVSAITSSVLRA
jgi:hypothetical protein